MEITSPQTPQSKRGRGRPKGSTKKKTTSKKTVKKTTQKKAASSGVTQAPDLDFKPLEAPLENSNPEDQKHDQKTEIDPINGIAPQIGPSLEDRNRARIMASGLAVCQNVVHRRLDWDPLTPSEKSDLIEAFGEAILALDVGTLPPWASAVLMVVGAEAAIITPRLLKEGSLTEDDINDIAAPAPEPERPIEKEGPPLKADYATPHQQDELLTDTPADTWSVVP